MTWGIKRGTMMHDEGGMKRWLMEMEEDARIMPLDEWIMKHGETEKGVYETVNGESEDEHEETF